jgi:hypothetical protein
MARPDLASPRVPTRARAAPGYESHYLTAVDPRGGRAVWVRYTSDKAPGESARGRLWCTAFAAARAPLARRTARAGEIAAPPAGGWARIDGAAIGPDGARGSLEEVTWELRWRGQAPAVGYLPRGWLYDRRLPRSNGAALVPDATFAGWVERAGERVDVEGWRGMVGHNWGADHADRWIWAHATGLGERDETGWLDVVLARTRVGGLLTPWLPAGALQLDGRRHAIGLGAGMRGLRVAVARERERVEIALPSLGDGLWLEAALPSETTARWDYATPSGGSRDVRNCSIASGRLRLGTGPAAATIELEARLVVEVGA